MKLKLSVCAATVLFLAACTHPGLPRQNDWPAADNTADFTADGRLAVKAEGKGSYANFDWTYQNQVQTINVNTPLGNTVGQLCQDREGVLAVDSKGRIHQAETAGELSRRLLGFELPLQYLHIWANGRRVADAPHQVLSDGRLQQFDWIISRTSNPDGQAKVLLLENARLSIRLAFDEINTHPETSGQTRCAARR